MLGAAGATPTAFLFLTLTQALALTLTLIKATPTPLMPPSLFAGLPCTAAEGEGEDDASRKPACSAACPSMAPGKLESKPSTALSPGSLAAMYCSWHLQACTGACLKGPQGALPNQAVIDDSLTEPGCHS